MANIIISEYITETKGGNIREWRFKQGNKILARLYFPNHWHTSYNVETRIFAHTFNTLEQAANFVENYCTEQTGEAVTIKDKKGYSLDLLVCFEDELLKAI